MNCQPGDLAIVVRSRNGNEGKIVRCIRLATEEERQSIHCRLTPLWLIDQEMVWTHRISRAKDFYPYYPDESLRPIRPQPDDAQDETLSWLPVPAPTTEKETA